MQICMGAYTLKVRPLSEALDNNKLPVRATKTSQVVIAASQFESAVSLFILSKLFFR